MSFALANAGSAATTVPGGSLPVYRPPVLVTAGRLQREAEPPLVRAVKARFVQETAAALDTSCFSPDAVLRLRAVVDTGHPDRLADAVKQEMLVDFPRWLAMIHGSTTLSTHCFSLNGVFRRVSWVFVPDRRSKCLQCHTAQRILHECNQLFDWPEASEVICLSGLAASPSVALDFHNIRALSLDPVERQFSNQLDAELPEVFFGLPTSIDRYVHDRYGVALLGCPVWGRVSHRLLNALHAVGYRAEAHAVRYEGYDGAASYHPWHVLIHDRYHRDIFNSQLVPWQITLRSLFLESWYQYYPWYALLCQSRGEHLVPLAQMEQDLGVDVLLDGERPQWRPSIGNDLVDLLMPGAMDLYRLVVAETYLHAVAVGGFRGLVPGPALDSFTVPVERERAVLREQLMHSAPGLLALLPIWLANPYEFDPMTE